MWQFARNNLVPGETISQTTGPSSPSSAAVESSSVTMGYVARSGGVCLDEFFADSLLFSGSNHTTAPAEFQQRVRLT